MTARNRNVVLAIGVAAIAAILFVLLSPGDDDEPVTAVTPTASGEQSSPTDGQEATPTRPAPPSVPTILVRNGQPVGGVLKIEANEGDRIAFKVDSDVSAEIHVHGFDVSKDVEAGQTVKVAFDAGFTGIFEAELEETAVPIAEIQVNP